MENKANCGKETESLKKESVEHKERWNERYKWSRIYIIYVVMMIKIIFFFFCLTSTVTRNLQL